MNIKEGQNNEKKVVKFINLQSLLITQKKKLRRSALYVTSFGKLRFLYCMPQMGSCPMYRMKYERHIFAMCACEACTYTNIIQRLYVYFCIVRYLTLLVESSDLKMIFFLQCGSNYPKYKTRLQFNCCIGFSMNSIIKWFSIESDVLLT